MPLRAAQVKNAVGAVADAVNSANGLQLDTPIDVSISRTIADCTLTLSIRLPAHAPPRPQQPRQAASRAQNQTYRPPEVVPPEGAVAAPIPSPASSLPFSPPTGALPLRPRGAVNPLEMESEASLLLAELERLKRKALSRGIDLDSQRANHVPPEDIARLRALFSLADSNGSGEINAGELQQLHFHMGEPLTDEEAEEAFQRIDIERTGAIRFDDFLGWYTLAHSKQGLLSKKGEAYNQRFQKLMAGIEGVFDVNKMSVATNGVEGTLEWRLSFHYADAAGQVKQISPWHDIPLFALDGNVHFVTEISQWTRLKLEIATNESLNPIKAAVKAGKPKAYSYGDMLFNYGALPQTWNDPRIKTDIGEAQLCSGDNDPLDAVELGTMQLKTGSVRRVKVLGALGLRIDEDVDWKILCICIDDPYAPRLNDIEDLLIVFPNAVSAMREWFQKGYALKTQADEDGTLNEFAFGGKPMNKEYAMRLIDGAHQSWKELTLSGKTTVQTR